MSNENHIELPLKNLLEELATQNFVLGTDTYLRIAHFINRNFDKIETLDGWKLHLAAILCQSEEQQNAFYETFDKFFERMVAQNLVDNQVVIEPEKPTVLETPPPTPPPVETAKTVEKTKQKPTAVPTKGRSGPIRIDLQFPTNPLRVWNIAETTQAVRPLLEKEWSPVEEWDIPLSITQTIRNGGNPTFTKRRRKVAPQYILLIEEQSARDHLAGFYAEMAKELSRRDMSVEYFFYDFVPDRCWRNRREPSTYTFIERIAAEYADAKLLIVGKPDGLLNLPDFMPSNLALDLLDKFKAVALLCNKSTAEWNNAELALCQLFPVVPANAQGLATLLYQWDAPSVFTPTFWQLKNPEPSVPPTRRMWDSDEDLTEDLDDLKHYLGKNGYYWLCAAAVYPEIYYELTALLNDESIKPNRDLGEYDQNRVWHIALLRLSRVRWFREGHIPTEARARLRDVLPAEQAKEVRQQLLAVLLLVKDKVPKDSYAATNFQFTTALYGFEKNSLGKTDAEVSTQRQQFLEETNTLNLSEIEDAVGRQFFIDNQMIEEISAQPFDFPQKPTESGFYVLWVDDKPTNNHAFETSLQDSIRFTNTHDTEGGIKLAKENYFDVVISDIGRPESKTAGVDLMQQLRAMGFDKSIVLFSANIHDKESLITQGATLCSSNFDELKKWLLEQMKAKNQSYRLPVSEYFLNKTEKVIQELVKREDDRALIRLVEAAELISNTEGVENLLSQIKSIRMRKGGVRVAMQAQAENFLRLLRNEKDLGQSYEGVLNAIEKQTLPYNESLKEIITHIRNLISETKTEEALDSLMNWAQIQDDRDLNDRLIVLKARFSSLNRSIKINILSKEEIKLQRNQIAADLLGILSEFDKQNSPDYAASSTYNLKPDITDDKKRLIKLFVNAFETGKDRFQYDALTVFADGKPNEKGQPTRQITYGIGQTAEQSGLRALIEEYIKNKGKYADRFSSFLPQIGREPLADNEAFRSILKEAGQNDPIMQQTQDAVFDYRYFQPAFKYFQDNGFSLPLSLLVIFDSYVHSGKMLDNLISKVSEKLPREGGNEKAWIKAYVQARYEWLSTHRMEILQKTAYRPQTFLKLIEQEKWDIADEFSMSLIERGYS